MVPTGLGQVVESVRTQLAASLAQKSIRLETDFADEAKVVLADRRLLEVVLRNLVSNAVKFSPSGGRIGLASFAENPDGIAIEVRDEGIGMSRDLVDNLWSLTARKGRPGTAGEPSSGLGLVLVKEAIQAMEGRIAVESREGEGTVFRIHLRGAREAPEPEPAIRGGG
jgi:signal transduction histidine kinase